MLPVFARRVHRRFYVPGVLPQEGCWKVLQGLEEIWSNFSRTAQSNPPVVPMGCECRVSLVAAEVSEVRWSLPCRT